jgi:hypothetical protein
MPLAPFPRDKITTVICWYNAATDGRQRGSVVRTTIDSTFSCAPHPGFRWKGGHMFVAGDEHISCETQSHADRFNDDEGATWIRGWPPLDSPDVQALLVAYALGEGEGAVPEELFAEDSTPGYDFDRYDFEGWYQTDDFEARGLVR